MNIKNIVNFFHELGMLRRVPRSGWGLIMIDPSKGENVAEHSLRAAQIAYVLAIMEGYSNPFRVCTMVVFHDSHETRTGDPNKVNRRYMNVDEDKAASDQYSWLDKNAGKYLYDLWKQVDSPRTHASRIAKDADILECVLTAREYIVQGYPSATNWMDNARKVLQTESANKLVEEIFYSDPNAWWDGLKKM